MTWRLPVSVLGVASEVCRIDGGLAEARTGFQALLDGDVVGKIVFQP